MVRYLDILPKLPKLKSPFALEKPTLLLELELEFVLEVLLELEPESVLPVLQVLLLLLLL